MSVALVQQIIGKVGDLAGLTKPKRVTAKQMASDRRDYGLGVKLWHDKDPRADHSFFLGGVPGFVLSQDQRMIDWNVAFETAFGDLKDLRRGMKVSEWFRCIDNFKRIPVRESKLYGEGVIPITDRERVVYNSSVYGRMVFMKIMVPILDRVSGRIIGWNITLNVNSVSERVKFFEDLHQRIDHQSRHSRYIVGVEHILARSESYQRFIRTIQQGVHGATQLLLIGAVKSEMLVKSHLMTHPSATVTVVDHDSEALRLLRTQCSTFGRRLRLVRRDQSRLAEGSFHRFDAIVILNPRFSTSELDGVAKALLATIDQRAKVVFAGYNNLISGQQGWSKGPGET